MLHTPVELSAPQARSASFADAVNPKRGAFTFAELLVVVGTVVLLLVSVVVPALARSQPASKAFQCQNNLRQLYSAWRQWTDDNADRLLAAESGAASAIRPVWMTGALDYNGANASNFDPRQDLARSPLWTYVGKTPLLFRCPDDPSTVVLNIAWNGLPVGTIVPRVRSVSMNSAFGQGAWLSGNYSPGNTAWKIFSHGAEIVLPAQTFLVADEHAGSMNDGMLNVACGGANSPSTARIIDIPASYHNGAANFSFADGHARLHQWGGQTIRPPFQQGMFPALNVPAGDSWVDVQWLAAHTTVPR